MNADQGFLLIVDDDEMHRDMLSRRLERKGYRVSVAEGGLQALQLVEKSDLDLVLLDIQMPGMSGMEVLKSLRKTNSPNELPVIMVTARSQSEDIVEALQEGANDYITKPIDLLVALARIQTHLSRKRAEQALRESEERYTLAFLGASDGLWDWNLRTNEIFFSPRWKDMLGYKEDEIGNGPDEWFKRVHPEELDRVKAEISAHLDGKTSHYENEHRILHKDGGYRWVLSRGIAVKEATGRPTRMAGSLTDMTKGKVTDVLTGLPNRLLLLDRLQHSIQLAKRHKDYLFAVLFLDLDQFKMVNNSLGHEIGDQLLIAIARRLEACIRSIDLVGRPRHTVARLGGDEFTILLEDIRHVSDATRVAERIQKKLQSPFTLNGHEVFTTASIGIAVSATGYDQPEDLLRDASTAMYRTKALGKARYEVFDPTMRDRALARMRMETDLRRAVERDEFQILYQPIVSLETGEISGFEGLVRWNHPDRGLVSPAEFVPVAEETGLIVPIDRWMLHEGCQQMRRWNVRFPLDLPLSISINLSCKQFMQPELIDIINQVLQETGLEGRNLRLEITETMLMENMDYVARVLTKLKRLNVQLAIDDFGTGYSSLCYLHRLPIDTLKIDRSFVGRMGIDEGSTEIVRTIRTLAHNLGMKVIAEGVETAEQQDKLKALACEYGQGYFFSKPVNTEAAEALIATERPALSADLELAKAKG